jgi:hypothetical protein
MQPPRNWNEMNLPGREFMFDSLNEQIEKSQGGAQSTGTRALRYVGLLVLSVVVFVALYMVIRVAG